jgi:hypothetical protein
VTLEENVTALMSAFAAWGRDGLDAFADGWAEDCWFST